MASEFVFILTVVLRVISTVFTVGERKSLVILFICIVLLYMRKLFLQCLHHPFYIYWGVNRQSDSHNLLHLL
jgi:hypothetical protein